MRFVAAFAAIIFAVVASAQVTTSSIGGRVSDADGVVVGAAVIATNTTLGTNYYTVTDKKGSSCKFFRGCILDLVAAYLRRFFLYCNLDALLACGELG